MRDHVKITANPTTTFKPSSINENDPAVLQWLYHKYRRKAVRSLKGDKSNICKVEHRQLRNKYFEQPEKIPDLTVFDSLKKAERPRNTTPFTFTEVSRKLNASENTGPDRIQYKHLRSYDTDAKILTLMFNICLKACKIPVAWKRSTTIFIPKKGGSPPGLRVGGQ